MNDWNSLITMLRDMQKLSDRLYHCNHLLSIEFSFPPQQRAAKNPLLSLFMIGFVSLQIIDFFPSLRLRCRWLPFIANVINVFRFHDALEASFHFAGLPFPGGKRQACKVGSRESEHIYDNEYRMAKSVWGVTPPGSCRPIIRPADSFHRSLFLYSSQGYRRARLDTLLPFV